MKISIAEFTVADLVKQLKTGDMKVNKEYQRSNTVWPPAARSYLIDTILHGYPVPKISLFQKTDLKSRTTIKEIVDGQQRSQAIRDFFDNKLRISGHSSFRGKTFEQLDAEEQEQFLTYALTADIFAAATEAEIREVFRRINSYNVPLNAAEKRHATFQGEFKWFIVDLCEKYAQTLKDLDIFSEQQLGRMYDASLFSEVCRTFLRGIDHASDAKLEAVYKEFDEKFDDSTDVAAAIKNAISFLVQSTSLHGTALFKSYNVYSIITAIGHLTRRFENLQSIFKVERRTAIDSEVAVEGLSRLSHALEIEDTKGQYAEFVEACAEKTNRKEPRTVRFTAFCKAMTGKRFT